MRQKTLYLCQIYFPEKKYDKLFTNIENKEIDNNISNYYLKVLVYKNNHDLIYDFVEYLKTLNNEKEYKKLITKYYKEYIKITEKIGNKDLNKYITAYEYVTPLSKRETFEYKVMKANLGEEKYYFEVGLAYAQGYLMDINNEKANKYIALVSQTITDCVIATNQTYVEALKKLKNAPLNNTIKRFQGF